MNSQSLRGSGRRLETKPKLQWNYQMRQTIHILYTDLSLSRDERSSIFGKIFEDHVRRCGVESVRNNIITAQWAERFRDTRSHDWHTILSPATTLQDKLARAALQNRVQEAANGLGIALLWINRCGQIQDVSRATIDDTPMIDPESSSEDELNFDLAKTPSRRRQNKGVTPPTIAERRKIAFVKLPASKSRKSLASSISPSTPIAQRLNKAGKSNPGKLPLVRRDGSTIYVSPKQYAASQEDPVAVSQHKAHPPNTGLLFRYWRERVPMDHDSYEGFVARKYHKARFWPSQPPPSQHVDITDVFNHMNREKEKTPFISTSMRLVWTFWTAMKELKTGVSNGRISIINASDLDTRQMFYAPPFHAEAKKQASFTNGAERYVGTSEILVWRNIPEKAIIRTFKVPDLFARYAGSADKSCPLSDLLGLQTLMKQNLSKQIIAFQARRTVLTSQLVTSMADLALFLGLSSHSPHEQIAHVVTDIIQGWGIKVTYRDDWDELADVFFRRMCQGQGEMALEHHYKISFGWLHGIHWGLGDLNARHDQARTGKVSKKAAAIGLQSPAQILARRADAEKAKVLLLERTHDRRIKRYHAGQHLLLLSGPSQSIEESIEVDDMAGTSPLDEEEAQETSTGFGIGCGIRYDDEESSSPFV